jgi:CO/xanthine dehydrogenase FAD-binding subunit
VVIRCRETEKFLIGKKPDPGIFQEALKITQAEISPIHDIRSTEIYRAHAAGIIAGRILKTAATRATRRSR